MDEANHFPIEAPVVLSDCYMNNILSGSKSIEEQWLHITSEQNPADVLSRGLPPEELRDDSLWWHGPELLLQSAYSTNVIGEPTQKDDFDCELRVSERTVETSLLSSKKFDFFNHLMDFSNNYFKIIHIVSYIYRFIDNCRSKDDKGVLRVVEGWKKIQYITAKDIWVTATPKGRAPQFEKHYLRRFMSRQGKYSKICTDNATNFVGTNSQLKVEVILNSRLLTPISNDFDNFDVLTPAHFLIGISINSILEPIVININGNRLSRWQKTTKIDCVDESYIPANLIGVQQDSDQMTAGPCTVDLGHYTRAKTSQSQRCAQNRCRIGNEKIILCRVW
ncbi:uncharacterized protein TNCV_3103841 [Trichonephila clavipes]|nr:uncharacterized protein TNCV_3103841 [Trichonephila clavipes]